jgi:tetratricopeptide (TPR) repeat protein
MANIELTAEESQLADEYVGLLQAMDEYDAAKKAFAAAMATSEALNEKLTELAREVLGEDTDGQRRMRDVAEVALERGGYDPEGAIYKGVIGIYDAAIEYLDELAAEELAEHLAQANADLPVL